MDFTFVGSPGRLNLIRSVSPGLALALACCMAAVRVHWFPPAEVSMSHSVGRTRIGLVGRPVDREGAG
jgi:hypothetical protein